MVATAASASALLLNGRRLAVRSQSPSSVGARAGAGGSSSMPAGVGGARVTPGVGITAAPCAQPLSTTAAVSRTHNFLIGRLFFARALITGTH